MKLKKIASLALAGVMAVSMLAGCSNGSSNNGGNTGDGAAVSIVDAVNNGQSIKNKVKVTFTSDAALESAAQKAVEMYGDGLAPSDMLKVVKQYASLINVEGENNNAPYFSSAWTNTEVFYSNEQNNAGMTNSSKSNDGEAHSFVQVVRLTNSPASDAYIQNLAADVVDSLVANLDDTNKVVKGETGKDDTGVAKVVTKAGDNYQDYSYTGKVCLVENELSTGVTHYYLVTVLTQTVTNHKLEK